MSVKAVKTLTVSGATALEVLSAPPKNGEQTEDIETTTLSDSRVTKVPRFQIEETSLKLKCAYNGTLATVGATATLTVAVLKDDGNTLTSSVAGYIKSSVPGEIDVGGERKLVQEVEFMPNGTNAATTTSSGA